METVTGRQMEETPLQGGGSERLRGPCGASDWERSQPALGDRVEDAWNVTVMFVVMLKSESASAHQRVSQSCWVNKNYNIPCIWSSRQANRTYSNICQKTGYPGGKSTGQGHSAASVSVKVKMLVVQPCLTLCYPWTGARKLTRLLRPLDFLQARILEWIAISFSRGSSWPRDWTQVS